jgi:hypothetical protein
MVIGNAFLGGMSDGSRIVRSFPLGCEAVVIGIVLIHTMIECSDELHVETVLEDEESEGLFLGNGDRRSKLCSDQGIFFSCFGEGLALINLWDECLVYILFTEDYLKGFPVSSWTEISQQISFN